MRDEREFTQSSGDVFTDSGLDNPGEWLSKAHITAGSIWPFHGEFYEEKHHYPMLERGAIYFHNGQV